MRGHIVQRSKKKGTYSIKISLGKDATGKYKYQWFTVQGSKKDAQKKLSEILHQKDNGTFMKPGNTTVSDYLQKWLTDYARPNISPRGFERYQGIINQHFTPAFGGLVLTQLKPEHLQKHYTETLNSGLSASTVRIHHAVIHKALEIAVEWGMIGRNIADAVKPPRITRIEMNTWNEDEVNRFLEASKDNQYYALFYTALFTGMRRSELLALRWQDIDFIYSQIYVSRSLHHLKDGSYVYTQPKSEKSRRTIALPPSAFLTLSEYRKQRETEAALMDKTLKDDGLVFSTLGKPFRPNTITRAWQTLAAKAGVKVIRLHDARHTHASLMLKQGIHPKVVQERLGHASIQMTLDIYSHVAPGIQEAAAESFDKLLIQELHKSEVAKLYIQE
ncbi:tyrosine-type recombinase/integrase [Chloroflexota bacterium]